MTVPTDLASLKLFGSLPQIGIDDVRRESARLDVPQGLVTDRLDGRLCMHPDGYDEEIANGDPDELSHQLDWDVETIEYVASAMRQMEEFNNNKFPKGCHGKDHTTVMRYVEWNTVPDHNLRKPKEEELQRMVDSAVWGFNREFVFDTFKDQPLFKVALAWSDFAYRRIGAEIIDTEDQTKDQIHLKCKHLAGSLRGLGWFNQGGGCGRRQHVEQHIDIIRFELAELAWLLCHEHGHNFGEPHQFRNQDRIGGIMSYRPTRHRFYGFSTGQAPHVIPRDPSIDSLLEKHGPPLPDFPVDTPTPQPPLPPLTPIDDGLVFDGTLKRRSNGKEYLLHFVEVPEI